MVNLAGSEDNKINPSRPRLSQAGGLDVGSIVSSLAGGGVGGVVLMAIVGLIKQAMGKGSMSS
jgi:hypothetical protein